jgi:DNA-binding transcriptional LysR family regulator
LRIPSHPIWKNSEARWTGAISAIFRRDSSLKEVPTPIPAPTRDLWLVFHRDVGKVPAIRAVIGHLTEIIGANRKAFGGR